MLAEVKHAGSSIEITKDGESIATLQPARRAGGMTLKEFAALRADGADDPSFADDLERINSADQPPTNPWGLCLGRVDRSGELPPTPIPDSPLPLFGRGKLNSAAG